MSRRHPSSKRRSEYLEQHDNFVEATVDDLAHAATFAMMTLPISTTTITPGPIVPADSIQKFPENQDDEDIELEESSADDDEDNKSIGEGDIQADDTPAGSDGDDDDDDEDVDLAAELARMDPDEVLEEEEDEGMATGEKNGGKLSQPPKTENELDAYKTPIEELQKHLEFNLTVDENGSDIKRTLAANDIQLAGRLKHYMALDRTVVVESAASNPHGDASSFQNEKAPLDEGTLLFLRPTILPEFSADQQELVPLGRIFEVFGPVSQPLYTIRLPQRPNTKSKQSSKGQDKSDPSTPSDNKGDTVASASVNGSSEAVDPPVAPINREETAEKQPQQQLDQDPWTLGGRYAKILEQNNAVPIYFVRDEAKLIDLGHVMKISRKGCDASNLYDEEIVNTNEMYYSDDEEERQAKSRRGRKNQSQQTRVPATSGTETKSQPIPLPSGFHAVAPGRLQPYSTAAPRAPHPMPSGFHPLPGVPVGRQPAQNGGGPRPVAYAPYRMGFPGGGPPPPPPPSGGSAPPPAYQY